MVFDKTGTLTLPEPAITDLAAVPEATLARAARLALSSRHPLARALAADAGAGRPFADVQEAPGEGLSAILDGVEARLGSLPSAASPRRAKATDGLADRLPPRRRDRHLHHPPGAPSGCRGGGYGAEGARPRRRHPLRRPARGGGADRGRPRIDEFAAGLRPGDKIAALEAFKAEGRRVLMVGDGLNDAPALAAAHVALSPITAIDLTQAQADAVFLGERLQPVVEAVDISRKARRLMSENLASVYNAFAVPLAILGLETPLVAAVAMSGSSIVVTLNAPGPSRGRAASSSPRAAASCPPHARFSHERPRLPRPPRHLPRPRRALFGFLWSIAHGQFDDLEGAAVRVLDDSDIEDRKA